MGFFWEGGKVGCTRSSNIIFGMPDIPDIFVVNSRLWDRARLETAQTVERCLYSANTSY